MLYIEDNKVKITEEGLMFLESQELYKKDRRNESKPWFNKVISYVYHAYSPDGDTRMLLPKARREKAANLVGINENDMEIDVKVVAFIRLYQSVMCTPGQKLYETLKRRVEETITWLNSIPIKKIERKKVQVTYINPLFEKNKKEPQTETQWIDVDVEIDNSEEVHKAMKMSKMLSDQLEDVKKVIIKESKSTKKKGRMFDTLDMQQHGGKR